MQRLTIHITGTGGPSEWGDQDTTGHLLDEHGHALWGHFSSSVSWLVRDLTSNFGRNVELAEKYPEGWTCSLDGELVASWSPDRVAAAVSEETPDANT